MAALIRNLRPRIAPEAEFEVRSFDGKQNLLRALPKRLDGYLYWPKSSELRICVVLDRDADDCVELKQSIDAVATRAGMSIASSSQGIVGTFMTRLAIEELEAWFIADVQALRRVYPRLPENLHKRATFRNPDQILGGTWEVLERQLKKHGYELGGLRKVGNAQQVSAHMDPNCARSPSFAKFVSGVRLLAQGETA